MFCQQVTVGRVADSPSFLPFLLVLDLVEPCVPKGLALPPPVGRVSLYGFQMLGVEPT